MLSSTQVLLLSQPVESQAEALNEEDADEEETLALDPTLTATSSARGKGGAKAKTCSSRASLQFPVGCIHRLLRKGHYAERVGSGAPIYLAAILQYLTAQIFELASNAVQDNMKTHIISRHLQFTIRNDEELNKLLGGSP
ncbi:histone H2A-beta, sperm-like [Carcharodon carcharias]|uniref:histone H2A-beta, sperm-like n=1 Tax=Carcharodon carcharias TaxID=13397 RepID=UPI001B7F3642|nr:histone H2A-beta, sperm-like [Carcharodon carcharias]